jgi:hypothetical protein
MDSKIPNLNQDLLTQAKAPRAPLPKGFFTLLFLEALGVIFAYVAGHYASAYIGGTVSLGLAAGLSIFFMAMGTFATFFALSVSRRMVVIALETLAFVVSFRSEDPRLIFGAATLIFLFSLWGDVAARAELMNRLRVKFLGAAHLKIARTFTGLLLAMIILTSPTWRKSVLPVPEAQFRASYNATIGLLTHLYPNLNLSASVQTFAEDMTHKQLSADPKFQALPPDQQDKIIQSAAAEEISKARSSLKIDLAPGDRISDVLYRYIINFVGNWKTSLGDNFVLIWALALFFLLRGLGLLLIWPAVLLSGIIYELCAAFGVMSIAGEPAMQERLILSK